MPWSELQPGLMRSPLLRTLQGSSCLDLDISIVLASCSPELNMFQKCSNGWRVEKMHLKRVMFGVIKSHPSSISRRFLTFMHQKLVRGKGKERPKPRQEGVAKRRLAPPIRRLAPAIRRLAPAILVRMMTSK